MPIVSGCMARLSNCIGIILMLFATTASAKHLHSERYYQEQWCNDHGGKLEYTLDDRTRVDCLTDTYAIEFDFAPKWAEAVGQSLYYGLKTGKKPGIVLIIEADEDDKHLKKLQPLAEKYGITIWTVH